MVPIGSLANVATGSTRVLSMIGPLRRFNGLSGYLSECNAHFRFGGRGRIVFSDSIGDRSAFIVLRNIVSLHERRGMLVNVARTPCVVKLTSNLVGGSVPCGLVSRKGYAKCRLPTGRAVALVRRGRL